MKSLLKFLTAGLLAAGVNACATEPGPTETAKPDASAQPIAEIPYRLAYQGWFTIKAGVNGAGPYDFIVDSGATITSAFENLAAQQDFIAEPGRTIQILGLSGAQELPAYFMGDFSFGDILFEDHTGVILPDWSPPNTPPQGVMGLDFMSLYNVHFDTANKVIRFYERPEAPVMEKGWRRTRMSLFKREGPGSKLFYVNVQVRLATIPCILDLGASGTIFNRAAIREMMAGTIEYDPSSSASRINDVFDRRGRGRPVVIESLRIGGASWREKIYLVYDAQIFKDLGYENKPLCLIGADMFANRSFMFDFEGEDLYIGPTQ